MTTDLGSRAVLVSLNITGWRAGRTDKEITDDVARQRGIPRSGGHYHKNAMPDTPEYEQVWAEAGAMRKAYYANTLPWANDGARILPTANFETFSRLMREYRERFEKAARHFSGEYPRLIQEARTKLNGGWRESDYPSAVADTYSTNVTIRPLPTGDDFRVDLPIEILAEARAELEREVAESAQTAMQDAWRRIYEGVKHAAEILGKADAKVYDTLFSNLGSLCDTLDRLNLTGDAALIAAVAEVRAKLLNHTAAQVRNRPIERGEVAAEADRIAEAMKGFAV